MRKATQEVPRDLRIRRREWRLYAGDLKEFFRHTVMVGDQTYRMEGWIQRNPIYPIYAIRERDNEPFVMSAAEVNTDTQRYHPPADKRRRRHFEARAARAAKVAKLPRATLKVMRTAKLSHLPAN